MMHSLSKRMRNNPVFWYALFSAENVSISVINRGEASFRVCFSRITNPFNFVHPRLFYSVCPPLPLPLCFDKARAQNLPGNLHTIKATTSASVT